MEIQIEERKVEDARRQHEAPEPRVVEEDCKGQDVSPARDMYSTGLQRVEGVPRQLSGS